VSLLASVIVITPEEFISILILLVLLCASLLFAYHLARHVDVLSGTSGRQRHDYVVALLECAIRMKSEKKENETIAAPSKPVPPPEQPVDF